MENGRDSMPAPVSEPAPLPDGYIVRTESERVFETRREAMAFVAGICARQKVSLFPDENDDGTFAQTFSRMHAPSENFVRTVHVDPVRAKTTVAILKPDIADRFDKVIADIRSAGFRTLTNFAPTTYPASFWRAFYKEHEGKPFFEGLVEFMSSGPALVLELFVKNDPTASAVDAWRYAIGPATPQWGTFRGRYGKGVPNNGFHGSDSEEAAKRELALFESFHDNL